MRYALVGVSTVGFVVTAVATWMPTFYQNQLHLTQQASNGTFGALAILGGIPGTLIGGRIADKWVNRFLGARVVIPAVCIVISAALFMVSFIPMAFASSSSCSWPGSSPPRPASPRCGPGSRTRRPPICAAPGSAPSTWPRSSSVRRRRPSSPRPSPPSSAGNYRTAFLIILPIAFLGAACLMLARTHIEQDAAKVFEAVVMAMAAQQAEEAAWQAARAEAGGRQRCGRVIGGSRGRGPGGGRGRHVARQRVALSLDVGERLVVPDLDHAVARVVAVAVDDVGRGVVARGRR